MEKHNTKKATADKPAKLTKKELEELAREKDLTIGVDLGDKQSHYCVIGDKCQVLAQGTLATTKTGFNSLFQSLPHTTVAMEAGTHSPWASRHLVWLGHEVIVANPRQLPLITESKQKNDRVDAEKLARVARMDVTLLNPIHHRSEQAQLDLGQIRMRAGLVAIRTAAINEARGQAKSLGYRLTESDADAVNQELAADLPAAAKKNLDALLETAADLTVRIKAADKEIQSIAKRYPEITLLTAIYGVGDLTALTFILTIEDAERFAKSREVGAYLGMVPGQSQSGERNPQQRITKQGDRMTRWMLVQCAHCILKRGAPDSDLRTWGLNKIQEQKNSKGKVRKKKVLVAVARKLAVLMHHLWATGEVYDPLYNTKKQEMLAKKRAA